MRMKRTYPLTIPQKNVWEIQQFYNGTSIANVGGTFLLEEELNFDIWEKAINLFIEKNDSVRLQIKDDNGAPRQYLEPYTYRKLEFVDFTKTKDNEMHNIISSWIKTPFDIFNSDLFEFKMIRTCNNECGFFIKFHHLISDAWTIAILGQQTTSYYRALKNNTYTDSVVPSYIEYIENEKKYFASKRFQKDESYWRNKYLEKPPLSPVKKLRPINFNPSSDRFTFDVHKGLAERINIYCKENSISPAILFEASLMLYLNKFTSEKDITIGVLSLNRSNRREKQMTGMFINTLPLRFKIDNSKSFLEMCRKVSLEHLAIFKHQKYPYRQILNHVREQHGILSGLFDVVVSYQNAKILVDDQTDSFKTIWYPNGYSEVPLKINIDDRDNTGMYTIHYDYQTSVFNQNEITQINNEIMSIIEQAVTMKDTTIKNIKIDTIKGANQIQNEEVKKETTQVAIAATFTSEPIGDYIKWWGNEFGHKLNIEFTGYNQVFQELLNINSTLSKNTYGINIVLIRFEDFIRNDNGTEKEKILKLEQTFEELINTIHQFKNTAPFIYTIFPVSTHLGLSKAVFNKISELNKGIINVLSKYKNIHIIDLNNLHELYNVEEVFDIVKDREGHMPFTEEYYAAIGTEIARKICAIKKQHFKVIVLDCDNTLWEGICGEQGALGVKINNSYRELQEFMLQKSNEGMLLAICSKNNEKDVLEVFDTNPDMILDRKHIVNWKVNWQEKSQNIREIADELNLGLDSFIFIDDSPIECSKMVENCPEVLTLQLPKKELIPMFLKHIWAFDRAKITKEDTLRSAMYIAEQKRKELEATDITFEDFMKNLELKVSMRLICESEVGRAAQLTQRTNQFNLSTIRRTEKEIIELMKDNKTKCFIVEASDKFGDYGIIGLIILKEKKDKLFIDTFLLSCRILGRKVEDALLSGIRRYAKECGIKEIEATFIPTAKNQPILDFIERTKWIVTEKGEDNLLYKVDISDLPEDIEHITFYYNEKYKEVNSETIKSFREDKVSAFNNIAVAAENIMECELCDTKILEGTKHKEYLLPIKNFTGRKLLKLPINKDVEIKTSKYEAPRNELEQKLVDIWKHVLKVERVGINDNFFELGGDSLKAVEVLAKTFKYTSKYNSNLSVQDFYEYQTVSGLSNKIRGVINSSSTMQSINIEEIVVKEEATCIDELKLNNIFLTGATGYLGIHILNNLITETNANIYLLIRARDQVSAENRLIKLMDFYFEDRYTNLINNRIFVLNGDITQKNFGLSDTRYNNLGNKVDTIIHSAAIVKYFGEYKEFENVNVFGTKRVIDFALKYDIKLNHISTVGISGSYLVESNTKEHKLSENDFYIGQNYMDNVYVRSKFEAENFIHKAMKQGLKASVFRMGNLAGRYSDGHFQHNIFENAFYRSIKSIIEIGAVPEQLLNERVEITPVDYASKAVVKIIKTKQSNGRVFHIFNHNELTINDLVIILNDLGFDIKILDKEKFVHYLEELSKDESRQNELGGIINDINESTGLGYKVLIGWKSDITQRYLEKLGLAWPLTSKEYIARIIEYAKKVGFILK